MRTLIGIYYPDDEGNALLSTITGDSRYEPVFKMPGQLAEFLGFNKLNNHGSFDYVYPVDEGYKELIETKAEDSLLNNRNNLYIGIRFEAIFEPLFLRKDSFIVETLSIPLESFNSSIDRNKPNAKETNGSRRNILATIPFTDSEALVQYEPNEIVYIDIKNDNKLDIRNLELRVLDNNFDPIRIVGEADLTLLIDN